MCVHVHEQWLISHSKMYMFVSTVVDFSELLKIHNFQGHGEML